MYIVSKKSRGTLLYFGLGFVVVLFTYFYLNMHFMSKIIAMIILIFYLLINVEHEVIMIFFLTPFAYVFKFSPDTFSLVLFLEVILIAKILFGLKKVDVLTAILAVFFVLLQFTTILVANALLSEIIKITIHITFVFCAATYMRGKVMFINLITSYIFGVFSSLIAEMVYNQTWHFDVLSQNYFIRYTGLWSDPNFYAQQILLAISFLLILLIENRINKMVGYALLLLLIYYGTLSYSKMYFVTLVLLIMYSILYMMFRQNTNQKYTMIKKSIFLMGTVAILVVIFINILMPLMMRRLVNSVDISSSRLEVVANYLKLLWDQPIYLFLGCGFNNAPYILQKAIGSYVPPHNIYISALIEYGLLGLASCLLYMNRLFVFVHNIKLYNYRMLFLGTIMITGFSLSLGTNPTFFIVITLLSFAKMNQKKYVDSF